jgi:hypothetical protein
MARKPIPTSKLTKKHLPADDAGVSDLIAFAHTFDSEEVGLSFDRLAEIANGKDHSSIDNLRACLFFEARRWRHIGDDPDQEALQYWRSLVAEIKGQLICN